MTLNGLNNTLTITNTGLTTLGGVIQDGTSPARSLTKLGAGTLVLNGSNTYTGQTNILGGIVNIQNSSALGSQQQPAVGDHDGECFDLPGGTTACTPRAANGGRHAGGTRRDACNWRAASP